MLKKTITCENFDGETITEDLYFNLSEAELMELQLTYPGGLVAMLEEVMNAKDTPSIVKIFKDLILKAYGEKSADGKHFMKSEEIRRNFECSSAYSDFFMEVSTNAESAANFINNVIPKKFKLSESEVAKMTANINA